MKTKIFTFLLSGFMLLAVPLSQAQNVLYDGGFDLQTSINQETYPTPLNIWVTFQNSGIDAPATIVDKACYYQINSAGSSTWEVQLTQYGFNLVLGHAYNLSFRVKADAPRTFGVFLGEYLGSWTNLLGWDRYTQSATTEWQTISLNFDATNNFATNKISFELGGINTSMYFDDIILTDLGPYLKDFYDGDFSLTSTIVPYISNPLTQNVWCYLQNYGISANATVIDKVCNYEISNAGFEFPEIQLIQTQFNMVPGHSYQLSFDVKADADRIFGVYLGEDGGNWTNLLGWDKYIQNATTGWKTITLDFVATNIFSRQKLSFELGGTSTSIYFDNVVLQDKGLYIPTISVVGTSLSGWDTDIDMQSTDGIHYTLSSYPLTSGDLKFRQNHDWVINWGNNTFPTGNGYQDGPNIPIVNYGNFDISFNRITGEYSFVCVSNCPAAIGITGTAVPPNYDWGPDVNMLTNDGKNYFLNSYTFTSGTAKFRQDDNGAINWGGTGFPSGAATMGGPEIPVPAGVFNVKFNIESGEYSFKAPDIGIIGDALNGWDDDIDMQSNDGITYTLLDYPFAAGTVKFRANNTWDVNWGSWSFPTGFAYLNSWDNIPVLMGTYNVTFNLLTGEYSFVATTCPIAGIQCPYDQYLASEPGICGAHVFYPPVVAAANCGGAGVSIIQTAGLPSGSIFPVGITTNTFQLTNKSGNTANCSFIVYIYDIEPPVISGIADQLAPLWPPNHKMIPVKLNYTVSDNCGVISPNQIYIYSNEPENGLGDGDIATDWVIKDDHNIFLRAERSGKGTGRVYYIYIVSFDNSYNYSYKLVTVEVPHDKGMTKESDAMIVDGNQLESTPFKVNAWPNPATQNFNLQVQSFSSEKIEVYISDITGRRISKLQTETNQSIYFGDDLQPGMYIIEIRQGANSRIMKVVKQ